ncbi:hypothetical protein NEOKW01_0763 [Nematocida sp. AWRm80]|nr:hypothetical protein NEOKW01_0763 [Nematocida sp. AWRm80]
MDNEIDLSLGEKSFRRRLEEMVAPLGVYNRALVCVVILAFAILLSVLALNYFPITDIECLLNLDEIIEYILLMVPLISSFIVTIVPKWGFILHTLVMLTAISTFCLLGLLLPYTAGVFTFKTVIESNYMFIIPIIGICLSYIMDGGAYDQEEFKNRKMQSVFKNSWMLFTIVTAILSVIALWMVSTPLTIPSALLLTQLDKLKFGLMILTGYHVFAMLLGYNERPKEQKYSIIKGLLLFGITALSTGAAVYIKLVPAMAIIPYAFPFFCTLSILSIICAFIKLLVIDEFNDYKNGIIELTEDNKEKVSLFLTVAIVIMLSLLACILGYHMYSIGALAMLKGMTLSQGKSILSSFGLSIGAILTKIYKLLDFTNESNSYRTERLH